MALIKQVDQGFWVPVSNNTLKSVAPTPSERPDIQGTAGVAAVMDGWSGGAFDTTRNRLLVWGGGHRGYAGNEVYAFELTTGNWVRLTEPSPVDADSNEVYPDGNPVSRHTYSNLVYIPGIDAMYAQGGAYYESGNGGLATWLFHCDTNTWERKTDAPKSYFNNYVVYLSAQNKVIHHENNIFNLYTIDTDSYNSGWQNGGLWDNRAAAYSPDHNLYVIIGSGEVRYYDVTAGPYVQQTKTTTGATEILSKRSPGFVYDPVRKKFIAWGGGNTLYALNPDTWVWERHVPDSTSTISPGSPNPQGTYGRFFYSPVDDVFGIVNTVNDPVYLFRLGDGPGIPENEPNLGFRLVRNNILYGTINEALSNAQDGDTINVLAGRYEKPNFVVSLNDITIQCPNGTALFDGMGTTAEGKGICLQQGSNLTLRNIEFRNAKSGSANGAGIRIEAPGLTCENVRFFNNENGILGGHSSGDIILNYCEFAYNGDGSGQTHNLYVNGKSLTMKFCVSHHAKIGHNVKSRCAENYIRGCYIYDGPDGTASNSIDIPNGGIVKITGTLIHKGPSADNKHMFKFGEEGLVHPVNSFLINDCLLMDWYVSLNYIEHDIRGTTPTGNNYYNGDIQKHPFSEGGTSDCSAIEADLNQCLTDKTTLQSQLDSCNADKVVLQNELDVLRNDYTNVVSQLNTVTSNYEALQLDYADLQASFAPLQAKADVGQKILDAYNSVVNFSGS